MIKYAVAIILIPFLAFGQTTPVIEIGSFNLEWFPCKDNGDMMRKYGISLRDMPKGNSTDTLALMNLLRELNIELLGVLELVDPPLLENLAQRHLGKQFKLIYAPTAATQEVGFLYDSSVLQVIGQPQVYQEVALGPDTWLRPALRVYFKTIPDGMDFHAIVVHLKAAPSGWEQRKKQYAALEKILTDLPAESGDSDVIMMGDFNNVSQAGYDEFRPFAKRLNMQWVTSELAEQKSFSNYWKPDHAVERIEGSLIDQIFISAAMQNEFIVKSARSGGMCDGGKPFFSGDSIPEYYEKISDHCPVIASFRSEKDDD